MLNRDEQGRHRQNTPLRFENWPIAIWKLFGAHLKAKIYENDWQSKNVTNLISKIRLKLKDFCPDYFQRSMSKCKAKFRKAADMGPEYMFEFLF